MRVLWHMNNLTKSPLPSPYTLLKSIQLWVKAGKMVLMVLKANIYEDGQNDTKGKYIYVKTDIALVKRNTYALRWV